MKKTATDYADKFNLRIKEDSKQYKKETGKASVLKKSVKFKRIKINPLDY